MGLPCKICILKNAELGKSVKTAPKVENLPAPEPPKEQQPETRPEETPNYPEHEND
jgi:hypothetical protein